MAAWVVERKQDFFVKGGGVSPGEKLFRTFVMGFTVVRVCCVSRE